MKSINKKIMTIAVVAAMTATIGSGCVVANSNDIAVMYDGEKITFDVQPEIIDDRVMVPMRTIFEVFGAKVKWDGDSQSITAKKKSKTIQMTIGNSEMTKNDTSYTFDTAPVIKDGRTLVPVRAISDMLGLDVEWNDKEKEVVITTPQDEDNSWEENTGEIDLDKMTVDGEGIAVSENVITITSGGDFTVTGTCGDGQIVVDTEDKVKLRLSGMSLTNTSGSAVYIKNADKAYITITENTENILTDGEEYTSGDEKETACITSRDNLEIKGKGTLTVNANYKHGIDGSDSVEVSNGKITINAKNDGIHVNDTLEVSGGTLNITAEGDGMQSGEILDITGGDINVTTTGYVAVTTNNRFGGDIGERQRPEEMTDEEREQMRNEWQNKIQQDIQIADEENNTDTSSKGIKADWLLEISDGTVTINSTDHAIHCASDINITGGKITLSSEAKKGISGHGDVTIDDGEIDILKSTEGIESKRYLIINGGEFDITASDDGLNAGGNGMNAGGFGGGRGPMMMDGEMIPPDMQDGNGDGITPPDMQNGNVEQKMTPPGMQKGNGGQIKNPDNQKENGEQMTPPQMPNDDMNNQQQGMQPQQDRGDFENPKNNGGQHSMQNMGRNESNEQDTSHHIEINGGTIKIIAGSDGVDSNGSLFINGGKIFVDAQATGAESAFDTDRAFVINGGTVIGISGAGLDESPNSYSTQNVIIAYTSTQIQSGDKVVITDESGNEIIKQTSQKGGSKIVYSSSKLKTGTKYTVSVNDTEVGTAEISDAITVIGTKTNQGFGGGGGHKGFDRNNTEKTQNNQNQ